MGLFRSVLEHELKIKERIVMDFSEKLREVDGNQELQTLDVNVGTHGFKNHVDYVILLRRLAEYYEIRSGMEKNGMDDSLFVQ